MATDVRQAPATKHEAFIDAQLTRAEKRIRGLDLAAALLGFLAGTLAYAVLVAVLDHAFVLPTRTRQVALALYAVAAGAYLWRFVVVPLRWRVNPFYAARKLEETLPGARNSVVNWIDLHEEKLPPALRHALGQRAARDLQRADVDRAIRSRAIVWAGGVAAVALVGFGALFPAFGLRPTLSLLGRAFAPFGGGIATRTQVEVVQPRGGDANLTVGNAFTVVAEVSGRVPRPADADAPRLLFWRGPGEPPQTRLMQQDDSGRQWLATLSPVEADKSFSYKVAAGDAETPEYRVTVRASVLVKRFQATYRHRKYVGRADAVERGDTLKPLRGLRGTEVDLRLRATRAVKEGRLEFRGADGSKDGVRAEVKADQPEVLLLRGFVLDRPGEYRVVFTSAEGEPNEDPHWSAVAVDPDRPPAVALTEPGRDVELPANGVLRLKGEAKDDIGVRSVALHMQVVGGAGLRPLPYLADKLGKPGYGTPRRLDYQAAVDLAKLRAEEGGAAVALKPGDDLEYWLEAADACDYPKPNVAQSKRYRVKVVEPVKDGERAKDVRDAQDEQKKHEKRTDEQLKKQEADRQKERKGEEEREKEDARREEERDKNGGKGEEKKDDKGGEKGDKKGSEGAGGEEGKKDDDTRDRAEDIQKALDKRADDEANANKGEGKSGKDDSPGKGKGEGKQERGANDGAGGESSKKEPAGENKGGPPEGGGSAGEGKSGEAGKGDGKPEAKKGDGEASGSEGAGGEGKEGDAKPAPGKAPGKGKGKEGAEGVGKPDAKPERGSGKPTAPPEGKQAGEGRPEGKAAPDGAGKPEAKGTAGKSADGKPEGAAKERPASAPRGDGKDPGKKAEGDPKGVTSQGKGGKTDPGAPRARGKDEKPPTEGDGAKGEPAGKGKGSGAKGARAEGKKAEDATPEDVNELAKALSGDNKKARDDAARGLERIKDLAKDPAAREAARRELEKEERDASPAAEAKGAGPDGGKKEKKEAGAGREGSEPGAAGGAGKGREDGPKKAPEGKGPGQDGTPDPKSDDPDLPRGKGKKGTGRDTDRRGGVPGEGEEGRRADDEPAEEPEKPTGPRKPREHRPSMLQLEQFMKKVDKDILKDLKMSPEQFQQFLKDYEELAKRAPAPAGPDKGAAPSKGGTLPGMGGRTIKPGTGTSADLKGEGRGKAPPGYRDAHKDFLDKISRPDE